MAVTREVYQGTDNRVPDWNDLGGYLVRGLIAAVGAFLWALPIIVIFSCIFIGLAAVSDSDFGTFLIVMSSLCLSFLGLIYLAIVLPVPIARYAIKDDFGAMFDFAQIFQEIQRGVRPLLLALIVWIVAVGVIAPIGILACFVGVYVTTTLAYLMVAHAMGQAYREIDQLGPVTTQAF